eukprot:1371779-Rhodomonas_salina.1
MSGLFWPVETDAVCNGCETDVFCNGCETDVFCNGKQRQVRSGFSSEMSRVKSALAEADEKLSQQ